MYLEFLEEAFWKIKFQGESTGIIMKYFIYKMTFTVKENTFSHTADLSYRDKYTLYISTIMA